MVYGIVWHSSNTRLRTLSAFSSLRAFEKSVFNARGLGNAGEVLSRVFERTSESQSGFKNFQSTSTW